MLFLNMVHLTVAAASRMSSCVRTKRLKVSFYDEKLCDGEHLTPHSEEATFIIEHWETWVYGKRWPWTP
jgi:hypothetical protein